MNRPPFRITPEGFPYQITMWRRPILRSLRRLNDEVQAPGGIVLDLAGGRGPLSGLIDRDFWGYVVVDRSIAQLARGSVRDMRVCADVAAVPLADGTAQCIVTMTCLQYFDQELFFAECRRLLSPGGMLAIHENGPRNPFILAARLGMKIVGLFHAPTRRYRRTIRGYFVPGTCPPGFAVTFEDRCSLFTPLGRMLEKTGLPYSGRLDRALESVDSVLLRRFPYLRRFCFLTVVHYRRA